MAMIVMRRRPSARRNRAWYLIAGLCLACAAVTTLMFNPSGPVRWASLSSLPLATWSLVLWRRQVAQAKARRAIGRRLARLPDDFLVMHGLSIPSPWGTIEVDHLILSRFGLVVVGDGPTPGWMLERVEAIRSLLFGRGLAQRGFPIQALVLLAPGVARPRLPEVDTTVIRVEQIALDHVAPSRYAILTTDQIQAIARCLAGEKVAA